MGKFDFEIPDEFIKKLGKLEDVEKLSKKMIDEAIPILEIRVISEISKHKSSGDLSKSIKKSKAKKAKNGAYIASVFPTGKDKKGVRNAEKLIYLEYGTSNQNATPTLSKALKDSEREALNKMQEVFEREIK